MKKLLMSLTVGSLLATTFLPTFVSASKSDEMSSTYNTALSSKSIAIQEEITIVNGEDEITVKSGNDSFVKYQITEDNNSPFDLIFNYETEEVTVDGLIFDMDTYVNAINEKEGTIKERITDLIPKNIDSSYESDSDKAPQISTMRSLPTTGYGTLYNVGTYKKSQMKIGLATALLTLIASFVFKGNVSLTKTFVTSALKSAVSAGLITSTAESILSDVYYIKRQAFHKTIASAVKETRRPYTQIQSSRIYGPTATYYFWSSRPY